MDSLEFRAMLTMIHLHITLGGFSRLLMMFYTSDKRKTEDWKGSCEEHGGQEIL